MKLFWKWATRWPTTLAPVETSDLNNLFVGRREIIPSNQVVVALDASESGDRFLSMNFDLANLSGNDNGWSVAKYGTADADNNNVVVFRLAEMYLDPR